MPCYSNFTLIQVSFTSQIKEKSVVLQMPDKSIVEVPCGLVIWAAGNKGRDVTQKLMAKLPEDQKNKRGITVDGMLLPFGAFFFCLCVSHLVDHRLPSDERN